MKKITTFLFTLLISVMSFAQYDIDDTQNLTYVDISSTGTLITPSDDGATNITTPWTIYLGGVASTQLRVGNNGAVLFNTTTGSISSSNAALSTSLPIIAPFWDDFDTEIGGVYYETKTAYYNGVPIASKFIIQWDRVHFNGSNNTDPASFQLIFNRDSPTIIFQYADVDMDGTSYDNGLSATIGIATTNEVSQYSYNTASLNGITTLVFSLPSTNVPDDNFEAYLETHNANGDTVALGAADSMGNGTLNDNTVPTSRIENVTSLGVSFKNISDLTGIEDFTALTTLYCYQNNLTALDISANTALTTLFCYSNSLTTLDLSTNTVLTNLNCGNNNFTSLDLSTNTALTILNCYNSNLTELDLITNNQLEKLLCSNSSNLTTLNIQNGANGLLSGTYTIGGNAYPRFRAMDNPNLTCIFVDNATDATNGVNDYQDWDISNSPNAHYVATQAACDNYYTTNVPDDNFEAYLETHNANGYIVALGAADSMGNGTLNDDTVPTSRIENVTSLNISSKGIADLTGIEDFTALTTLYCYSNNLTALDVSANTALTALYCSSNNLIALNISTNTALTTLDCYSNNLTTLDVSTNTALTNLYCYYNNLTALNVSTNTALTTLNCSGNDLNSLDVSTNTALTNLYCSSNDLTALDVSANTALTALYCSSNNLIALNVSTNTALTNLYCSYNNISTLDLSTNNQLSKLTCFNNPNLTTLNIQNGVNGLLSGTYTSGSNTIPRFRAGNNPNLTCIFVDNATDATNGVNDYQDWDISNSPNAHYVATQAACDALDVADNTIVGLAIYPNPVQNTLHINALENVENISLYNMLGQEVLSQKPMTTSFQLDFSSLTNGTYIIKITSNKQTGIYQIIKN